jgi:hypothetical protein
MQFAYARYMDTTVVQVRDVPVDVIATPRFQASSVA